MSSRNTAATSRISYYFNKITKQGFSRSARPGPSKVTSPKLDTSEPAPESPSKEPAKRSHEESSPHHSDTREISSLPRSSDSLAFHSDTRALNARVKAVVRLIGGIRDGQDHGQLLIRRKLTSSDFRQLLQVLETDEALGGFFCDKIR